MNTIKQHLFSWGAMAALAIGCLAPEAQAQPAPILATTATAPSNSATKDPEQALYAAMAAANDRNAYIAVLKQISSMPDHRDYEIARVTSPEAIPFEKLSASQAKESTQWYTGYTVEVCVTEDAIRYHNDVLYPRYQNFFRKVCTREHIAQLSVPVRNYSGSIYLDIQRKLNEVFQQEKLNFSVLLIKPKISSFRDVQEGDKVELEVSYYELTEAYTAFLSDQSSSIGKRAVFLKLHDANGTQIRSYKDGIQLGTAYYRDGGCYIIAGIGLGHTYKSGSDLYVREHLQYSEFCVPSSQVIPPGGITATAEVRDPDVLTPEEQAAANAKAAAEAELAARRAAEREAYMGPTSPWSAIAAFAALASLVTLPFIIYAWVKEYRRRFIPLPLPEGWNGEQFDENNLSEELREVYEFLQSLQHVTVDGQEVPLYTKRKEVNQGFALIEKLRSKTGLSGEDICLLNEVGVALNQAQKRYLVVHKGFLIFSLIIFGILTWLIYSDGDAMYGTFSLLYVATLLLSLMCPAYKLANDEPWYCSWFYKALAAVGLTWLTVSSSVAAGEYLTRWKDSQDRVWVDSEESSMHAAFGIACIIMALIMSPFVIMLIGVNRFIRNYVAPR